MDTDFRYLLEQGKIYFKNQAYKKAEGLLQKIIVDKREFADVYNMLGVIYHQLGEFNRAISHFQKALKINPHYTEALLNLSVLYNDLGEYKLAKDLILKSRKNASKSKDQLDPLVKAKLANKHAEIGDLYRGVGLFKNAVAEYRQALELAPHFYDIRNRLGICLREDGKKNEALSEFKTIVKEKPGYADGSIQAGITFFSMGKKKEARKLWEVFAKANPKNHLVRTYLKLSEEKK